MRKIALILILNILVSLFGYSQMKVLLSREQNYVIRDFYKDLNIKSYIKTYGSSKNDSSIIIRAYHISILDSIGNVIYRLSYSKEKVLKDIHIYYYSDSNLLKESVWYRDNKFFDKSEYYYDLFGELKESRQLNEIDKLVQKSYFYRDKKNRVNKTESIMKGEISGFRKLYFLRNNFPRKEISYDFRGLISQKTKYKYNSEGQIVYRKSYNYHIDRLLKTWYYYNEKGLLIREEEYKNGKLNSVDKTVYLEDNELLTSKYGFKLPVFNNIIKD